MDKVKIIFKQKSPAVAGPDDYLNQL